MTDQQLTHTPIDGSVIVQRAFADGRSVAAAVATAQRAQRALAAMSLDERKAACGRFVDALLAERDDAAREITLQMGRPIAHAPGELRGFEERARFMIAESDAGLASLVPAEKDGFRRRVDRVPLGVVFVIAPWNYPYLTAVNAIVPALLAGNAVLLKHSAQTPLVAERLARAAGSSGLPEGALQALCLTHDATQALVRAPGIAFVAFTGSVPGGRAVEAAAAGRFIGIGLELGGKDPAYVRADADLAHAADSAIDGAFFNAGQSCCGIERIYVHARVYDEFVERAVALVRAYRLGDPRDATTTLGPMVRTSAATFVRAQIDEARSSGATLHVDEREFPASVPGTAYLAPQLLTGVHHGMRIMREETFGPAVGIMPVADDDEAVRLMNDSDFGLTAAIYSRDAEAAEALAARLETGTVFLNRCDYLDPALAWTGVKDSGRGCSLSRFGFEQLTRPKSFHFKLP